MCDHPHRPADTKSDVSGHGDRLRQGYPSGPTHFWSPDDLDLAALHAMEAFEEEQMDAYGH
jgi:hypothetical protein